MSPNWLLYERSPGFIAWATHGARMRYAIEQPYPGCGLVWRIVAFDGLTFRVGRESHGAFYDTGDALDHPEGALEWCRTSAVAHAAQGRALERYDAARKAGAS